MFLSIFSILLLLIITLMIAAIEHWVLNSKNALYINRCIIIIYILYTEIIFHLLHLTSVMHDTLSQHAIKFFDLLTTFCARIGIYISMRMRMHAHGYVNAHAHFREQVCRFVRKTIAAIGFHAWPMCFLCQILTV